MSNFTENEKQTVWNKANKVIGVDENKWRKDFCGAWIYKEHYGKETDFGWEVDHILPKVLGGDNNEINLRALHWENNRTKADDFPDYSTSVISYNDKNIKNEQYWKTTDNFISKLKKIYQNNKALQKL